MPLPFVTGIDVVGVYDADLTQVFSDARPLRALVREAARAMEHPLESGQVITDYRIILPVEISMPMIITAQFYADTYQQIRSFYLNSSLLAVQTRTQLYTNMIIAEMPHEEDPHKFNAIKVLLRFKEVKIVRKGSTFAPADPANTDTQQNGQQNPSNVITPTAGSFVTPTGTIVSGVSGATLPNVGPPVSTDQAQYNTSGVATFPAQVGFR